MQEYGRYFDMPTVCFRGGCLTGPNHAGAQLHGFLSYLMRCTVTGEPYTVFGYGGKQVRDNIHASDLVAAFAAFHESAAPGGRLQHRRRPGVELLDARSDRSLRARSPVVSSAGTLSDQARTGDHRWWISDLSEFRADYPGWSLEYGVERRSSARSTSRMSNAGRERERHDVKLSVVIPAHNEVGIDRRDDQRAQRARSTRTEIDYEIIVIDDASTDGTAEAVARRSRQENRASAASDLTTAVASVSPCEPGSTASKATRSRS